MRTLFKEIRATIARWDNFTLVSSFMGLVFMFAAVVLFIRLVALQVVDYQDLRHQSFEQVKTPRQLSVPRGTIYDRNGNILAMSLMTSSLYVDPTMLNVSPETLAEDIGPYVRISKAEIIKRAKEDTAFVWIDRMMEPEKSKAVEEILKKNHIQGVAFKKESRRFYPHNAMLSQVLGFVGTEDKGLEGLETMLENDIKGEPYQEVIKTDGKGRPILDSIGRDVVPKKERTVKLTIDVTIQDMVERALDNIMKTAKPEGACILIIDPKTGQILAMGNRPTFDPNHIETLKDPETINRAVQNSYEPGSTFKPLVAAAAIDSGKWQVNQTWLDTGSIRVNDRVISNWDGEGMGQVTLQDILKYSINTGMVHIGLTMGRQTFNKYIDAFGFGEVTGIDLPGEATGILFDKDDTSLNNTATMSIGQGISVTPLQMVRAFGALLNNGVMMRPYLVEAIYNSDGSVFKETKPKEVGQPIQPETAKTIANILEKEVSEGGGINAHVEGFHFIGKTGTAQKINQGGTGYLDGVYIASFIGGGPVEDPRFVMLIVIDSPNGMFYGGQVAAPVFKNLAEQLVRYYRLSPTVSREAPTIQQLKAFELPPITKDENGEIILPDFTGWTTGEVRNWLHQAELEFIPVGTGYAIAQKELGGTAVPVHTAVTVHFSR